MFDDGYCAWIHVVRVMGGNTSHPCCDRSGRRVVYLLSLQVVASTENLSLEYVNSNICILRLRLGVKGSLAEGGCL